MADDVWSRVDRAIAHWQVAVERVTETDRAVLVFGIRDNRRVIAKVIKSRGDEWRSGEVLNAFDGQGVVRLFAYGEGAMLLEWLFPGRSLTSMALEGRDDEATRILARTIRTMSARTIPAALPTVTDLGEGFSRYLSSGDVQIPQPLVLDAQRVFTDLCESQTQVRLLHGDLQHYNVLFDEERGWLAIDPKGVIGELEYEVGAMLRNPGESPWPFREPRIIRKRVDRLVDELDLKRNRVLEWAFSQAVLAAIWAIEDGFEADVGPRWIDLATVLKSIL
jgi:streptomycin 6-kinase